LIIRLPSRIPSAPKIKRINLRKKRPKNYSNVEDDPYEALVLYLQHGNGQLVEANIISNEVEENSTTFQDGGMT
jgi:hypothetical protein